MKPVAELTDQDLREWNDFMQWSLDTKADQIKNKKERHKNINFDNPQFTEKHNAIKEELKKRNLI